MKKLFIAALLVATIGTSAFAMDGKTVRISAKIANNFEAKFEGAKDVKWSEGENFTRATFKLNDQTVDAYYNLDGESIGHSRRIDFNSLPLNALSKIRKDYANYSPKEVIEFDRDGDKTIYVSLTNGIKEQILEVSPFGSVNLFRGSK